MTCRSPRKAKSAAFWVRFFIVLIESIESNCSLNQTGTKAAGANVYSARSSVYDSLYLLNVRLEGSVRTSVGVGYLDSESNRLSAYFTLCHLKHHPFRN